MIKAVFFDFDGVLTVEATGATSIVNYVSKETGIEKELFENEYRRFNPGLLLGKTTHAQIWGDLCAALDHQIPYQVLVDSFLDTELDTRVISLAETMKSTRYKIGIITDNKADRMKAISDLHRLDELFDVICVSAALGHTKSGKEIFLEAAGKAGVSPEEAVFIDNSPENLTAPRALGMKVIHFDHDERDHGKLVAQLARLGIKIQV
ncbi:HAD-IA family hydrolase [Candidatus Bathyarchaeota archaeon]|nr:HAD-IA family hydrolase [Candidatus Bathyarchaeota archaeon]